MFLAAITGALLRWLRPLAGQCPHCVALADLHRIRFCLPKITFISGRVLSSHLRSSDIRAYFLNFTRTCGTSTSALPNAIEGKNIPIWNIFAQASYCRMSTIYDPRYIKLIEHLASIRSTKKITQQQLAKKLDQEQSFVSKVESIDRRLDIIELYDWLAALEYDHKQFFQDIEWFVESTEIDHGLPALPVPKAARDTANGVAIQLAWQGEVREVVIGSLKARDYLALETKISGLYSSLNLPNAKLKNREAIYQALCYGIEGFPEVNPSDIYHHIVYRLYLREYTKTQADRSWVRAGGEALELFLESHYSKILNPLGIGIRWLVSKQHKIAALKEMGLTDQVGGSKLDIVLYGKVGKREVIFGGIHVKASLAERVSDDVPCSEAMISKGYASYLVTLDAKSFPPPYGDLINRGELGTLENASDKRNYVEVHGSFSACFSYNLRSVPSGKSTRSGRKIYSSTFDVKKDPLPEHVRHAWDAFQLAQKA